MTREEKAAFEAAQAEKKARQAEHRAELAAEERARILAALPKAPAESLLRMACNAWAMWQEAVEVIEAEGPSVCIRDGAGFPQKYLPIPQVAIARQSGAEYQKLAAAMGLGQAGAGAAQGAAVERVEEQDAGEGRADDVARFVAEECEVEKGARALSGALWARFLEVHGAGGLVDEPEGISRHSFYRRLTRIGYKPGKSAAGRTRLGLRLKGGGPRGVVVPFRGDQAESAGAGVEVEISAEAGPPAHLSEGAAAWWRSVVESFQGFEDGHRLRTLTLAAEAWDEAQQARAELGGAELTIETPQGPKRHPLVMIRANAQTRFAALVRELGFDLGGEGKKDNRPPRVSAARGKE